MVAISVHDAGSSDDTVYFAKDFDSWWKKRQAERTDNKFKKTGEKNSDEFGLLFQNEDDEPYYVRVHDVTDSLVLNFGG